MNRFLSFLTIALIAAFLVGRSGMVSVMGSIDGLQLSERGEISDDAGESDVAIAPPAVTLPPPGPQGLVLLAETVPVLPALVAGIFRPPCSLRA